MSILMLSAVLALGLAQAKDSGAELKAQPPNPRHMQDFTAYTVQKGQWRVGLADLDYGLFENASIGTGTLTWILGPSVRGKITAIETEKLAFSFTGTYFKPHTLWMEMLTAGDEDSVINFDASMRLIPMSWRGSWIISDKWSAHYGNTWTLGRINGQVTGGQVSELIGAVTGSELDPLIVEILGDTTIYADALAKFTLARSNFAVEWRRNGRDSLIFESNNYLWISGLIVGTAGLGDGSQSTTGSTGTTGTTGDFSAGVAATFEQVLTTVPSAVSLSYQWSWDRLNVRVGIPLAGGNPFSYTQAFQMYWLLGPRST